MASFNNTEENLNITMERNSSAQYRQCSNDDHELTQEFYRSLEDQVIELMNSKDITREEALQALDPNYEKNKWLSVEIEMTDLVVGQEISSDELPIIIVGTLQRGLFFNDTVALTRKENVSESSSHPIEYKLEGLTYDFKYNDQGIHSGDIQTRYGLEHIIKINNTCGIAYIISTPFDAGNPRPITTLTDTYPIFEIRVIQNQEMKRYILAQDFSVGENNTAVLNGIITKNGENSWIIKVLCTFLPSGFADDLDSLIRNVTLLEL